MDSPLLMTPQSPQAHSVPGSRGSRASTRPSLHLRRGEEVDKKVEEEEQEVEEEK